MDNEVKGLQLYKALTKSRAVWEGDVCSHKWSEYLAVPHDAEAECENTLQYWKEEINVIFKEERTPEGTLVGVWIS